MSKEQLTVNILRILLLCDERALGNIYCFAQNFVEDHEAGRP